MTIGKTRELSSFPDNDYTDEGQLIGHIVIGVEMLDEAIRTIPDFPVRLANELKHCIIAHHGELEYGSPKKPALAEAVALNLADNADAKMQTLTEIFKGKTGTDWLGFNRLFDSNLRRRQERKQKKPIVGGGQIVTIRYFRWGNMCADADVQKMQENRKKREDMCMQKNDTVVVEITDIGVNGEGIGKIDGYTLFIKDAVIGDVAEVKVIKAKEKLWYTPD